MALSLFVVDTARTHAATRLAQTQFVVSYRYSSTRVALFFNPRTSTTVVRRVRRQLHYQHSHELQ